MADRICTYTSYLSESSGYLSRNFWKNSKKHSALPTVIDASLTPTYTPPYSSQANGQVLQAVDARRELKLIYSITEVPSSLFSCGRRFVSLYEDCQGIYRQKKDFGLTVIKALKLLNTIISLSGLLVFKPLKVFSRQYKWTAHPLRELVKSWEYLSVAKSCSKILYLAGSLATSAEKVLMRSIKLVFEVVDVLFSALQFNHIRLPLPLHLTYSVAKSLFNIYRLVVKAA